LGSLELVVTPAIFRDSQIYSRAGHVDWCFCGRSLCNISGE
jgi:hypothetical protein